MIFFVIHPLICSVQMAKKVQGFDVEKLIQELEDKIQSWTPQTLEEHPQCRLLAEKRLFLTSAVVKQLICAIFRRMSPIVTQILKNAALSMLASLIKLLLGLVVQFSIKSANSPSLSSACVASLKAQFCANVSKDYGADVEFCAPLTSFVAGGLSLPEEFSLSVVDVQLPKELNLELKQRGNDTAKLDYFESFISSNAAYPMAELLGDMKLPPKTYVLQDEYGFQSATLDPFSQYMTIGGTTFIRPQYDAELACVYFSSFHHSNYGRILALSYDPERSTFYAEVSESSDPTDGDVEWLHVQLHRLRV